MVSGVLILFVLLIYLAVMITILIAMWKMYEKANKPGWASIVPIYNIIVLLEIVRKPLWWIALLLIPFANIVFLILIYIELAKVFGKDSSFAVGLIFLSPIFIGILGFGNAKYIYADSQSNDLLDS